MVAIVVVVIAAVGVVVVVVGSYQEFQVSLLGLGLDLTIELDSTEELVWFEIPGIAS